MKCGNSVVEQMEGMRASGWGNAGEKLKRMRECSYQTGLCFVIPGV